MPIGLFDNPYIGLLGPEEQTAMRRNAMLQAALGLLESSGPSRTPVSFGQALSRGAQQGLGAASDYAKGSVEAGEVKRKLDERKGKTGFVAALRDLPEDKRTLGGVGALASRFPGMEDAAIGALMPQKEDFTLGEGERRIRVRGGNTEVVAEGPPKPPPLDPSVLREFQQAQAQGLIPKEMTLPQYLGAKAGAVAGGQAQAKATVEAGNALPAAQVARDTAIGLIDTLLSEKAQPALEAMTGNIEGRAPVRFAKGFISQDVANLQVKLNQLTGAAWLAARDQLKGGGPIANQEGARAEAAKARLDTTQSTPEFRAALIEFKDALTKGFAALESQARGAPQVPTQGGGQDPATMTDEQLLRALGINK